jgi:hypothetical protein
MARTNQQPQENQTDAFKAEDESITTNKAATAVPILIGEGKTTLRWLTPIYGQRVVKVPAKSGGKK